MTNGILRLIAEEPTEVGLNEMKPDACCAPNNLPRKQNSDRAQRIPWVSKGSRIEFE